METRKYKASVLAVSLIIMGVMLVIALGISFSALQSRKSSIGSSKSNVAFQNADSGVEILMQKIKENNSTGFEIVQDMNDPASIGSCNNGIFFEVSGKFKVELKNSADPPAVITDCAGPVSDIAILKSTGYSDQDSRAIEAAVGANSICTGNGNTVSGGLQGFWNLNEKSGNDAQDSSTNENDGALHNSPSWLTGAINFDGVDDYISTAANNEYDSLDAGTVLVWARFDNLTNSSPGENIMAEYGTIGTRSSLIGWSAEIVSPGKFKLEQQLKTLYDPGTWNWVTSEPIPIDSGCHLVAFTNDDASRTKIYMDDDPVPLNTTYTEEAGVGDETDFIADINGISSYNHQFNIGARLRQSDLVEPSGLSRFFRGQIGEVQLYDRALSACEVKNIYDGTPC